MTILINGRESFGKHLVNYDYVTSVTVGKVISMPSLKFFKNDNDDEYWFAETETEQEAYELMESLLAAISRGEKVFDIPMKLATIRANAR